MTISMEQGERYRVAWKSRDLGYGSEEGEDTFVYRGLESLGKLTLDPVNGGPTLYLFEDEILDVEPKDAPQDVWELLEEAPVYATGVADLYHWSTNYDAGNGPFALFLDMIGYSDEEFGQPLYGPAPWDAGLGYVELDKLGSALREYADRPHDVRAFVDRLMVSESEGA